MLSAPIGPGGNLTPEENDPITLAHTSVRDIHRLYLFSLLLCIMYFCVTLIHFPTLPRIKGCIDTR